MDFHPPLAQQRFAAAYQRVEALAHYDRYLAAYVFGSFARGEATEHSDLDVHVMVNEENPCANINHPIIAGVKLDLSFGSLNQLKEHTGREMEQRERVPVIAESLIVFDKTGELATLQMQARQVKPRAFPLDQQQFLQFMRGAVRIPTVFRRGRKHRLLSDSLLVEQNTFLCRRRLLPN